MRTVTTALAAGILAACSDANPAPAGRAAFPEWTLSPDPVVTIGAREGAPATELYGAVGSRRLDDGRIVVANAGSGELRFFDSTGGFVAKAGRKGAGPGEYQLISQLYRAGGDSLLVLDRGLARLSVVDGTGRFGRLARPDSVSGDSTFRMDVWLYGPFWVEGALSATERTATRTALDRVPTPTGPGWRRVRRDRLGRLWVAEPSDARGTRWTVLDGRARPLATLFLPAAFEPQDDGDGWILGRWRDADEVEFVRLYRVAPSGATAEAPAWLAAPPPVPAAPDTAAQRAAERAMGRLLRGLVIAQETYYADHGTYASVGDSLPLEPDPAVTVDILRGTQRGWVAVGWRPGIALCAMAVGDATPPGWPEGVARCGDGGR